MPTQIKTKIPGGGTSVRYEYSDEEIIAAWNDAEGQGNSKARECGDWCIWVQCDQKDALEFSRIFIRSFAIPSCCTYFNSTWVGYCGDASSSAELVLNSVREEIHKYCSDKCELDQSLGYTIASKIPDYLKNWNERHNLEQRHADPS